MDPVLRTYVTRKNTLWLVRASLYTAFYCYFVAQFIYFSNAYFQNQILQGPLSINMKIVLCAGLTSIGVGLCIVKHRFGIQYGCAEMLAGFVINWVNIGKSIEQSKSSPMDKVVILLAGMFLIKRGMDSVITDVNKKRAV